MPEQSLLGIGLYTTGEASRLAGIPAARLRRWLTGYWFAVEGKPVWSPPIWSPEVTGFEDILHLGFRDLLEARIVDRFRIAGLSLQQLRSAHGIAQDLLRDERPFSTATFKTDGRRLYLEIAQRTDEPRLIELLTKQHSFHSVVAPSLRSVDFEGNLAARWWPDGGKRRVVVDPARSFGRPIIAVGSVPTDVLADAYVAEGSYSKVAALYRVKKGDVQIAVNFQQKLAA